MPTRATVYPGRAQALIRICLIAAGLLIVAVIAVPAGADTHGAAAADGDPHWIRHGARAEFVGGKIGYLDVADGQVVLTHGARLKVYSETADRLLEEYVFDSEIQEAVVSPSIVAAIADDGSVVVTQRGSTPDGDKPSILRIPLVEDKRATGLAQIGDALLIAVVSGEVSVHSIETGKATRQASLDLSTLFPGDWWVMDMVESDDIAYALIWESNKYIIKVIAISPDDAAEWSLEERLHITNTGQPRELLVENGSAALHTGSGDVYVADLETGAARKLEQIARYGLWPVDIALSAGRLYVLGYDDSWNVETSFKVLAMPVKGADDLGETWLRAVDRRVWEYTSLDATRGLLLLGEEDQLTVLDADQEALGRDVREQVLAPAFRAIVFEEGGDLVISRPNGLCRMSREGGELEWCGEASSRARWLFAPRPGVIVGVETFRIFSMLRRGAALNLVEESLLDQSSGDRYLSAASTTLGFAVLRSIDPPRAPLANFEVAFFTVSERGEMVREHSLDVRTDGCDSSSFAGNGDWLGLLCESTVWEVDLAGQVPTLAGRFEIGQDGLSLHVTPAGLLAVGTETGLQLYDLATRDEYRVWPEQGDPEQAVVAVGSAGKCLATVVGGRKVAEQQVWFYCPDDSPSHDFRGRLADRFYADGAVDTPALKSPAAGEDLWLLTGTGAAIHYEPDRARNRLHVPFLAR